MQRYQEIAPHYIHLLHNEDKILSYPLCIEKPSEDISCPQHPSGNPTNDLSKHWVGWSVFAHDAIFVDLES